ncbi:unnamed protein product (macronuclear) [Paramecium tetraurelia]|uniref:Amino acid transporter transmembrane domain-containing protein n=1 Tax=Paramecium tetraurelia TaxID=5888 RepID=A0BUG7_PARTE|nr:uncharacterized protein GSPATT00032416001 [Paramecium tetraurelia]CAK62184.1 unnamed protein product [Paramecium tetraurelia]|eukprot:XP_001429582.1 hypothetical protein (macronuclear) [Paramecium tetraurelia strain d4-2]
MLAIQRPDKTQSSVQTIVGIVNSMVGSLCLVLPLVFLNYGVISCTVIMIILGFVQYNTCSLLILHLKDQEVDTEHMIKRILGKQWMQAFRFCSGTLLFIVGIIYFQLINLTLYPIITYILSYNDIEFADASEHFVFNKFSIQWQALIVFLPLSTLLLIKDITTIVKIAHYGVIALFAYGIFIIYIFIVNLASEDISQKFEQITLWSWEFSQPAGQFALAFMIHNAIGQLIKNNEKRDNNSRDLAIAYGISGMIYGIVGIFGSIGIWQCIKIIQGFENVSDAQTILNCFKKSDVEIIIIESLFLVHLVTAFPIFNNISKYQILEVLYHKREPSKKVYWGFSVLFMILCLTTQILNIPVGLVISFDGAVCGFLLVYIVPISLHLKCYYTQNKVTLIGDDDDECNTHANCVNHKDKNSIPMFARIAFYALMMGIGIYNLIVQFYDIFKS